MCDISNPREEGVTIFFLSKVIISWLNSLYKEFWWGYNDDSNKIQWIDWGKLGMAKVMGGLGVRDIQNFNLVMLAKQCWRILIESSFLVSKLFKQKYHLYSDFIYAIMGKDPSFVWRSYFLVHPS